MNSYDFSEKAKYRWRVWTEIEKCVNKPRHLLRIAYLDTREGLETISLLHRGYNPANLLAINRNPAEVAMMTSAIQRAGYPRVRTAGVEWMRAITERAGTLDAVNFDGMGCLSEDLVTLVRDTVRATQLKAIAVNLLGGREPADQRENMKYTRRLKMERGIWNTHWRTSYGKQANPNHAQRISTLFTRAFGLSSGSTCATHITSVSWDVYVSSSHQPMVWTVVGITPHHLDTTHEWIHVANKWHIVPRCNYYGSPAETWFILQTRFDQLKSDSGNIPLRQRLDDVTSFMERLHAIEKLWKEHSGTNPFITKELLRDIDGIGAAADELYFDLAWGQEEADSWDLEAST